MTLEEEEDMESWTCHYQDEHVRVNVSFSILYFGLMVYITQKIIGKQCSKHMKHIQNPTDFKCNDVCI